MDEAFSSVSMRVAGLFLCMRAPFHGLLVAAVWLPVLFNKRSQLLLMLRQDIREMNAHAG
jgi:hypothetical protein